MTPELWVGIGALVATALGAWFTFTSWQSTRRRKRLSWWVYLNETLVRHGNFGNWSDLEIRYGQETVLDPRLIIVRIRNTGKVEIRADDIEEPLSVIIGENAQIIASKLFRVRFTIPGPSNEIQPIKTDGHSVTAPPGLINTDEGLEWRLLVNGRAEAPDVQGHVAGVNRFDQLSVVAVKRWWDTAPGKGLVVASAIMTLIGGYFLVREFWIRPEVPSVVGRSVSDARQQIEDAGLTFGGEIDKYNNDALNTFGAIYPGSVIETIPTAGSRVDRDTKVVFVVYSIPLGG
jgi:hypothetical protein